MSIEPQPDRVELGSASHRGQVRDHNEDSLVAAVPDLGRNPYGVEAVIAVADGIGGHLAGEVASRLAAETVMEVFAPREGTKRRLRLLSAPRWGLRKAVSLANARVYERSEREAASRQMGTTLTIVLLHQGRYVLGHVGDSRAYLITESAIEQVSEDHTWVAAQVREGVLTEEEAAQSPFRNQIVRSIGVTKRVRPDVTSGEMPPDGIVLVCSDGLSDMVPDATIGETLRGSRDLQTACAQLVDLANENGGHDNITVVAARYVEPESGAASEEAGSRAEEADEPEEADPA